MNTALSEKPQTKLHPAADIGATIRLGLLLLTLAVGGAGTWACVATLSAAIIAPGVIKVEDNRKSVQHREGGIVSAILVKEGEHVTAGGTLIMLGDEAVAAQLQAIAAQLDAETAKAARLDAESSGAEQVAFPSALQARGEQASVSSAMQSERAAFLAKRRALDEQLSLLDEQSAQVKQEIAGLERQAHSKQSATALMRDEVRTHQSLSQVGFVSKMQVLRLQRNLEDYEAQRSEYLSNIARARQRLAELAVRRNAVRSQYRQGAADELPATRARIATLEQQVRTSRDAARRQAIVAPIAGKVVDLKVFTLGGVVAPGATLMEIVPDASLLIVEARLNVDDVAHAKVGMRADVRINAYSIRSAPLLIGELRQVSADRMTDPATGRPYYLAQIAVDAQSLRAASGVQLQPGMAAEVFLNAGSRTPLDYLVEPIRNAMRRAARQPA
jgi:HlyD family type I secretion membrane fusion protein